MLVFIGSGTMIEDFRQGRVVDWDRDWLKILVKTLDNWTAQSISTCPEAELGPAAFLMFTALSVHRPQCTPHFILLHGEDVAAVDWWM